LERGESAKNTGSLSTRQLPARAHMVSPRAMTEANGEEEVEEESEVESEVESEEESEVDALAEESVEERAVDPKHSPPTEPAMPKAFQGDPLARPLPSLRRPILTGRVREQRMRRLAIGGLLAGALGIFAVVSWLGDETSDETVEEDEEWSPLVLAEKGPKEEVEVPAVVPEGDEATADAADSQVERSNETPIANGALTRTRTPFGAARGFRPALLTSGLSGAEAVRLEQALGEVLDFRRCHATDSLVVERAEGGALVRFEYHDGATSFVRADVGADDVILAERIEIPLEITRVTRGGVVRSSLGDAVAGAGLGRQTVGLFIEVFDGKVNFSTQARAGDSFRLVVDEERLNGEFLRFGQVRAIEYIGQRAGTLRAYFFHPREERRGDWFDEDGRAIRGGWLRVPTRYDRISSPFNLRRMHPILRRIVPHNGVDFAASTGTPVWAAADGTVTWASPKGPNGNLVSIRHAGGYTSHYAHLHQIQRGIAVGTEVEQRQVIGTVGTTGRSTGPHLHFGLKRGNRFLDAMEVINGPGQLLPGGQRAVFRREMTSLTRELERVEVQSPPPTAATENDEEPEPSEEVMD
jgi:murein DD-endopeptidase MepM/ murein hydrolase activator NlpD